MYKYLQSIAAFAAVAETGTFKDAARKLGVNAPVVSHHVSRLEKHLGATLIYRTTRKLTLSEQGRRLFEAAKGGLDATQAALDRISDSREEAVGALSVALPAFVPESRIEGALHSFALRHPYVSLKLHYSDGISDMLDDGIDLSLRLGALPTSSFLRRRLCEISHVLAASPGYLSQYGEPEKPCELKGRKFIMMPGLEEELDLSGADGQRRVALENGQISTNSIYGALNAARMGLGIASLPETLCRDALATGDLVLVLPQWELPRLSFQAVWPETSRRQSLTKRLLDHLADQLR